MKWIICISCKFCTQGAKEVKPNQNKYPKCERYYLLLYGRNIPVIGKDISENEKSLKVWINLPFISQGVRNSNLRCADIFNTALPQKLQERRWSTGC